MKWRSDQTPRSSGSGGMNPIGPGLEVLLSPRILRRGREQDFQSWRQVNPDVGGRSPRRKPAGNTPGSSLWELVARQDTVAETSRLPGDGSRSPIRVEHSSWALWLTRSLTMRSTQQILEDDEGRLLDVEVSDPAGGLNRDQLNGGAVGQMKLDAASVVGLNLRDS
jgi:hypothetical protein